MANFRSDTYYEKTGTMSVVTRATGKTASQIFKLIELNIIEPGRDEFTNFKLFSVADIDVIKFVFFCKDEMRFSYESLAYLIPFLRAALPDLTWSEIKDLFAANIQRVNERIRAAKIARQTMNDISGKKYFVKAGANEDSEEQDVF